MHSFSSSFFIKNRKKRMEEEGKGAALPFFLFFHKDRDTRMKEEGGEKC